LARLLKNPTDIETEKTQTAIDIFIKRDESTVIRQWLENSRAALWERVERDCVDEQRRIGAAALLGELIKEFNDAEKRLRQRR